MNQFPAPASPLLGIDTLSQPLAETGTLGRPAREISQTKFLEGLGLDVAIQAPQNLDVSLDVVCRENAPPVENQRLAMDQGGGEFALLLELFGMSCTQRICTRTSEERDFH